MAFSAGQVLTAAQLNDFAPGTRVQVPDGTAAAPSVTNTGDENTGIYWPAEGDLGIASQGNLRFEVNSAGYTDVTGLTTGEAKLRIRAANTTQDSGLYFGTSAVAEEAGIVWDYVNSNLVIYGDGLSEVARVSDTQILGVAGSASAPTYSFGGDTDTGMYRGSGTLILGVAGSARITVSETAIDTTEPLEGPAGSASAPTYSFSGDPNTGMYWVAADQLGFAAGGTESFRIVDSGTTQEIFPGTDNAFLLGTATKRWEEIYAGNATINTSDIAFKDRTGDPLGLDFVRRLDPFAGTWKPEHRGRHDPGRVHQWLAAQDVAAALEAEGIDPATTNLWRNTDAGQSLAYAELIPVLVAAVQELADKVDA